MLPAETVSTHTIFCLRDALPLADQWCLCGILNGFVANYLVRLRGGTHVPAAVMHALPAPRPSPEACERIASWTNEAATRRDDPATRARLHAETARIYGLDANELRHVLSTFPLVPEVERTAVLDAFCAETGCDIVVRFNGHVRVRHRPPEMHRMSRVHDRLQS